MHRVATLTHVTPTGAANILPRSVEGQLREARTGNYQIDKPSPEHDSTALGFLLPATVPVLRCPVSRETWSPESWHASLEEALEEKTDESPLSCQRLPADCEQEANLIM
ncbi:hypothetical protein RRG08_009720 [Elysia crispata]|uniref:Uncharacterized protein n=1 Tax=Elysia crispata TaxID=231223 RepID=A0AAE0Y8C6_9GAST|nr:hypothetical protein RRG08_009720 [Elysia crispata]